MNAMTHVIEPAPSARAKCRGCGQPIDKGTLRLGERLPNPYREGEMTLWFHLACAAYKRPDVYLQALQATSGIDPAADLEAAARRGVEHKRVARIDGIQRSPSGRSHCRQCRELIDKGLWRIRLVYYEEGRFQPSGYIHLRCAREYFETTDVLGHIRHFSPDLAARDLEEIRAGLDHETHPPGGTI
jgi:hypothetical protein